MTQTISLKDFLLLQRTQHWSRNVEIDFLHEIKHGVDIINGTATVTSSWNDLAIIYFENFSFRPSDLSTFETKDQMMKNFNFLVVEGDEEIDCDELLPYLSQNFTYIDYEEVKQKENIKNKLDGKPLESFYMHVDNEPNLKMRGRLIASVASPIKNKRHTVLALYLTEGEKYVCREVNHSDHNGERIKNKVHVAASTDEIKAFFGHGWLAKQLYEKADIPDYILVH